MEKFKACFIKARFGNFRKKVRPTVVHVGKCNNDEKCIGGPWTWKGPGDLKSCIDLVIISVSLLPYVKELKIDEKGEFAMNKVVSENRKLTLSTSDPSLPC